LENRAAVTATQVVHAGGQVPTGDSPSSSPAIHHAVTYHCPDAAHLDAVLSGEAKGFVYRRLGSPTVDALEQVLAELEGTESTLACESGMAALHLAILASGAHSGRTVMAAQDLYGGTCALLTQVLAAQGMEVVFADLQDMYLTAQLLQRHRPSVVIAETISNPLLAVCDVPQLARLAHSVDASLVIDNTFATPVLYRPHRDGADYVVHSATKYLGGHGDVLAGIVAASGEAAQRTRTLQQIMGHVLDPTSAWLLLRSLKTLVVRMRQQCAAALAVAHFLSGHPRVATVHYPGLPSSRHYVLARRLFAAGMYGAIVSFEIADAGQEQVFRFMDALGLVVPSTSLGDVCSLLLYPWHSSHRSLSEETKLARGIGKGLVRLSVGIEDAADIIADLGQALARV